MSGARVLRHPFDPRDYVELECVAQLVTNLQRHVTKVLPACEGAGDLSDPGIIGM